jgi:hypothetical protein
MSDKLKSDTFNVISAMIDSLSLEETVQIITAMSHAKEIPILMCHMQSRSGDAVTVLDKANVNNPELEMRYTCYGFPSRVIDKTVEMLTGDSVPIMKYKTGDVSASTMPSAELPEGKVVRINKPKGW